jgi:phosphoribosyl 1,2-cyclic phosphodiesterase
VRLRFCGVRGSTPAPGAEFVRVGGHTSCLAVTPYGADGPTLLLDAGTGIRTVTSLLDGRPFRGTILLTHVHWDHVQGLPFFAAGDRDDAVVRLLLPDEGVDAVEELRRMMSPPNFPIGPEGLRGDWRFEVLDVGRDCVEGLRVVAVEVPHKGGRTFGYRIEDDAGSFAYVPDHLPASSGADRDGVLELIAGVDVLIHDAQFVTAEIDVAEAYGHSTVDQALALAAEAGVGELVLFHHAPGRTDDQIDAIARSVGDGGVPVSVAAEGTTIDLAEGQRTGSDVTSKRSW